MSVIANKDTFIPAGGGAVTIHVGPGKILTIIMSTEETAGVQSIILYDSLTASGDILIGLRCPQSAPYSLFFASNRPLTFNTGLTVDPGDCNVHLTLMLR